MILFVAVDVGAVVAEATAALVATLADRAARVAPQARVAWVSPARLHLTVAFLGEGAADRLPAVCRALEAGFETAAFAIDVQGIGVFPARGRPRVVWAGIGTGRDALTRLATEVEARLTGAGIPIDPRPYHPHVTLARVRDGRGLEPRRLCSGLADSRLGMVTVDAITLFESRRGPGGSAYVPVQTSRLPGRADS